MQNIRSSAIWKIIALVVCVFSFCGAIYTYYVNHSLLNSNLNGQSQRGLLTIRMSDQGSESALSNVDLYEDLGTKKISATDPRLLKLLREKHIFGPSNRPYNLTNPKLVHGSQLGQSQVVDKLLKQKQNGFFVEAGAADGERLSNSLFFERFRNWTGLLVEADPWSFNLLTTKHRKAYAINSCLSLGSNPERIEFLFAAALGGISQKTYAIPKYELNMIRGKGLPQCFPIHSMLAAIGSKHVDFFTLDVEGAEIEILRNFPWDQITVNVWAIEYAVHGGGKDTPIRLKQIREIFEKTGAYAEVNFPKGQDVLFLRKNIIN